MKAVSSFLRIGTGLFTILYAVLCAKAGQDGPRIACEHPFYDFGEIDNTNTVVHPFVISNVGDAPLKLEFRGACCGTKAELPEAIVLPGSNTTFVVGFSLQGRRGKQNKSIYLTTNDPHAPYYRFEMSGVAVPAIDIRPGNIDFGAIETNTIADRRVSISCRTNLILHVTNVVTTVAQFKAVCEAGSDSNTYDINIRTVPPFSFGVTRGDVFVHTDHPKYSKIRIPVAAAVLSDLIVIPKEIRITSEPHANEGLTHYVLIRSRAGRQFNILDVEAPGEQIKIHSMPLASGGYRLKFTGIETTAKLDGEEFTVTTNHEEVRRIVIPIHIDTRAAIGGRGVSPANNE